MRSLYKLLERVFDRVNRDGGVCGQVTHSRYKTTHISLGLTTLGPHRQTLHIPVTTPCDGFFYYRVGIELKLAKSVTIYATSVFNKLNWSQIMSRSTANVSFYFPTTLK